MNIFDFGAKMELDGKAYYEKLAEGTADTGLRAIFQMLAEDEQKHFDTLKKMQSGTAGAMADSQVIQKTKNLFETLIKDKSIAGSLKTSLDGYEHARKVEADSVRFYEDMETKMTDPETVKIIRKIAAEERDHYNILDNLYDYTLAPQNFLAWAEFSNIGKEL